MAGGTPAPDAASNATSEGDERAYGCWRRALALTASVLDLALFVGLVAARALALTAPVLDLALFVGLVAAGAWRPAAAHELGWTPGVPLIVTAVRIAWLAVLVLVETFRGAGPGRCTWLLRLPELLFPYACGAAYSFLGVVRLISDEPTGLTTHDNAFFWIATGAGLAFSVLEVYTSQHLLPALCRQARERRSRLRGAAAGDSLNLDLLEGGEGGLADGAPDRPAPASGENKEKKSHGPTMRKLFGMMAPDWPLLIQAAILLGLAAITEACIPKYISVTIAKIIAAEEHGTLAKRPFVEPVIKLLITAVACGFASSCRGATFICIGGRCSVRLRHSLFNRIMLQEIGFFDTTKTGELTSRMTQDCQKVSDQVTLNFNIFLRTLVSTGTTLVFMFSISRHLTYVAFVSVPIIVVLSKKYGKVMQQLSNDTQKALADANAVAEEGLSTMSTLRSFAAEELESVRFHDQLLEFGVLLRRQAKYYVGYLAATIILPNCVTALVLFYGGKLAMEGTVKAQDLLAFVLYLQTLNSNFMTLGDFYTNIVTAVGAATRTFELMEREPELPLNPAPGSASTSSQHSGALRLEDCRFSYPARPGTEVLKGLTLDIPAGQVVSLVGPSGNGKSTIIGLLKRLYKAQEGRVSLDGTDIWDFGHSHYHRVISIVGQEPVLYARTIRENIVFGLENPPSANSGISDEEVFEATRKANAYDFITAMPNGFETEVGEGGVQLSGGQKQRIAIARALVRRPKVLLLDEATSALDAESERQVQVAIDSMIAEGSMTVIIIAHRLSTVRNSHKICVIQGGQVVEEGSHDKLVATRGAYFKLVECQLSGSMDDAPTAAATAAS